MKSHLWAFAGILIAVTVAGCSGTTTTPVADPLAGSWTYEGTYNNATITSTLVFSQDGNFNGYTLGIMSLSGHWTKINATAYNVYYNKKTAVFLMNGEKTQIWDGSAPQQVYIKQ